MMFDACTSCASTWRSFAESVHSPAVMSVGATRAGVGCSRVVRGIRESAAPTSGAAHTAVSPTAFATFFIGRVYRQRLFEARDAAPKGGGGGGLGAWGWGLGLELGAGGWGLGLRLL